MATHVWVKQGRSCLATARAAWKSLPSSINHKVFKINSKCLTHSWLVVLRCFKYMCFCNQSLGCLSRFYPDWVWYPPVGLDAWCGKGPPWESPEIQTPRIRCGHQRCVPCRLVCWTSLHGWRSVCFQMMVWSNIDGFRIFGTLLDYLYCYFWCWYYLLFAKLRRCDTQPVWIPAPLVSWNLLTSLDPFPRFIGSNPGHLHSVEVFQRIQQHWLSPAGVLLVNFVGISAGPREAVNLYGSQLEAQIKPNMIKHHRCS